MRVITIGEKVHQLRLTTGVLMCDTTWPLTPEARETEHDGLPTLVTCGRCLHTIGYRSDYGMERKVRMGLAAVSPAAAWGEGDAKIELPQLDTRTKRQRKLDEMTDKLVAENTTEQYIVLRANKDEKHEEQTP